MANKKIWLGMAVLALSFGLVLAGCNNGATTEYVETEVETEQEVNIAYLRATFPVLNFALTVFDINQNPTFINIERVNTFNYEKLPANVYPIPGTSTTAGTNFWLENGEVAAAAELCRGLYLKNKNIKFNLYVCDSDLAYIIYFMVNNGIPAANYSVTCYMDGSGSYTIPATRYAVSDASKKLENDCAAVSGAFEKAARGEDWLSGLDVGDNRTGAQLIRYTLAMCKTFNNITWVVNDSAALVSKLSNLSDEVEALIAENRIVEKNLAGMVQNIQRKGKTSELEYLLKLRWGEAEDDSIAALFNKGNEKKTLMILGTNTGNEDAGDSTWGMIGEVNQLGYKLTGTDGFMEKVIDRYGDDYNIFYKGHPATPTSGDKQAWFDEHDITDIRASIPAETMMYLYDGVFVGGYPGSTFQSALDGQCVVSFGTPAWFDKNAPSATLAYFTDTEYMYKDGSDGTFKAEKR